MRYLCFAVLLIVVISSCEKVTCKDPQLILVIYGIDTTLNKLAYHLKRYQKGTDFKVLLDTKIDTAHNDVINKTKYNVPWIEVDNKYTRMVYLNTDDDYILFLPTTGVEHKVYNINRQELKGVRHPFQMGGGSCSVTKCYNYLSYTINGSTKNIGGRKGCYGLFIVAEEFVK